MRFVPSLKLTIFVLVFLPVLIALGCWQLQRGDAKAVIERRIDTARGLAPRDLGQDPVADAALGHLSPVRLTGVLAIERLVLLDNRTHEGRVGYEVYAPLLLAGDDTRGQAVLLNLGWVAAAPVRTELPRLKLPSQRLVIRGVVARDRSQNPVFGPSLETGRWPLRAQRIDMAAIASELELQLYPWPVIADAGEPGVQTHVFAPVRMSSDTHYGYAAQWFGLALVLALGWLVASLERTSLANGE